MWQRPCTSFGFRDPTHVVGAKAVLEEEFHQRYVWTFFKVLPKPSVFLVHALHRPYRSVALLGNLVMDVFELNPHLMKFTLGKIISQDHETVTVVFHFKIFVMPRTHA